MSTVPSPTPPIAVEPDIARRLTRPYAQRGGARRANPAVVDTCKGVSRH